MVALLNNSIKMDFKFLSDPIWWLLLVTAILLVIILVYQEVFRFELLNSRYSWLLTKTAVYVVILFIGDLIVMIFYTGWFSMFIGAVISLFLMGNLISYILRKALIKTDIQKAVNSKGIKALMTEHQITENEIRYLYDQVRASEKRSKDKIANVAISNPEFVSWFFQSIDNGTLNKFNMGVELLIKLTVLESKTNTSSK